MPDTWIGVDGVPKKLVDPWVGTAGGVRQVQKIWVGTSAGTKLVFERYIDTAVNVDQTSDKRWDRLVVSWGSLGTGVLYTVKQGTRTVVSGTSARSVTDQGLFPGKSYSYSVEGYRNGMLVGGGSGSGTTPALTLTLTVAKKSWSSLALSWGAVPGVNSLKLLRGTVAGTANHTEVTTLTDMTKTSWDDTNLSSNTKYFYTLEAWRGEDKIAKTNGSHNQTTNTRVTLPKDTGTILASSCASYRGSTAVPSWGVREYNGRMWIGYGDSLKDQHSGAFFPIPGAVRWCAAVTKVEVSFRVQYANSRTKQWPLVVMVNPKDGSWPATWPGSTGRFMYPVAYGTDTWLGCTGTAEWLDITNLSVPGWGLIKDLVRNDTLKGIGFAPDQNSGYGYANFSTAPAIRPRLRVQYSVWEP